MSADEWLTTRETHIPYFVLFSCFLINTLYTSCCYSKAVKSLKTQTYLQMPQSALKSLSCRVLIYFLFLVCTFTIVLKFCLDLFARANRNEFIIAGTVANQFIFKQINLKSWAKVSMRMDSENGVTLYFLVLQQCMLVKFTKTKNLDKKCFPDFLWTSQAIHCVLVCLSPGFWCVGFNISQYITFQYSEYSNMCDLLAWNSWKVLIG